MFSTVRIEGFRGLRQLEMSGLGRVNLLVGKNNCGKTSVLEALYLMGQRGDRGAFAKILESRGARSSDSVPGFLFVDLPQLFNGSTVGVGSKFGLEASNGTSSQVFQAVIDTIPDVDRKNPILPSPRFALYTDSKQRPILLSNELGLAVELTKMGEGPATPPHFLTGGTLATENLIALWNKVVLKPEESTVLAALRILDPRIERVAAQSPQQRSPLRGGFIVKLAGETNPVPIASFGDGVWRVFTLAVALTQCRGGVLLIDEIDTGLHHGVMLDMWKLVYRTAIDLDVQVFATTHSFDCVHSFASLAAEPVDDEPISIQRIVAGKPQAVRYTMDELIAIADHYIEVR